MDIQLIDNRYRLINMIGSGGYSRVFLAYDTYSKMNVAIKILYATTDENDKNFLMFQQESVIMANVIHNNVTRFYGSGITEDGNPYLVMEHVKGRSLHELIQVNAYLNVHEVYHYMVQIIDGIEAIHNANIVHRDIKPKNIIIKSDGKAVVIDLGTSFISVENQNIFESGSGSIIGTVQYMSPELFKGEKFSSPQSDIYALGISLFEMLTGKVPFKSDKKDKKEDVNEVYNMHLHADMPSVKERNPLASDCFDGIIKKCCEKEAKNRYKNIEELRKDLNAAYDEYCNPKSNKKTGFFSKLFRRNK